MKKNGSSMHQRVSVEFNKNLVKRVQKELMMKRGIKISEERITLGLARLEGLVDTLVNANWLDEEIRRAR